MTIATADEFESHRPRMFGLAYRMLGSAEEAEDTVQDAYLRWSGADRGAIGRPAAWLAKVVTNLCLNRADVTWWADGGGKVTAARRPILGREKVLRFLASGSVRAGLDFTVSEVNGAPALVAWVGDVLAGVVSFEVRGGLIARMRAVMNPDKLVFVGRQLARS